MFLRIKLFVCLLFTIGQVLASPSRRVKDQTGQLYIPGHDLSKLQRSDVVYCDNMVPNLGKLAAGVDITQLDLNNDFNKGSVDGLKSSVIAFTCNSGKKFTIGDTDYDLPDQVDSMFKDSSGVVTQDATVVYTLEKKKETMGAEAGVDITAEKGAFSASAGYKTAEESMKNMSSFVTSMKAISATSKAVLQPATGLKSSLDEVFEAYIGELEQSFESNPQPYYDLIKNFGTHYFTQGQYGGTFSFYSVVDNEVRNKMTDEEIQTSASADFLKILSVKGAYNHSTGEVAEFYKENRRVYQKYLGGQANLLEEGSYKDWWPTVPTDPWLTHVQVKPITDLIDDSKKKSNLATAIEVYMAKAYLTDLMSIMNNLAKAMADPSSKPSEYSRQINETLAQQVPDMYGLRKLVREVEAYTVTPSWFLTNVKITIGYNCPGPAQKLHGLPNQMIPDQKLPKGAINCLAFPFKVEARGQTDDWFNPNSLQLGMDQYVLKARYDDPNRDYPIWLKAAKFCAMGRYWGWGNKYTDTEACVRPGIYGFNFEEIAPTNSDGVQDFQVIIRTNF